MKQSFIIALIVLTAFTLTGVCLAGPKKRRKTGAASEEARSFAAVDELIESLNGESDRRDFTDEDFSALKEMDLSGKEIEGYIFDGAIFPERTDFSNSKISWCSFEGASVIRAKFKEAKIVGSSFVGAKMYSTDFTRTTIVYCNFEGTYFSGIVYGSGDKLSVLTEPTLFLYTTIKNCNFIRAVLKRANFTQASAWWETLFNSANIEECVLGFRHVGYRVNFRHSTPAFDPERECEGDSVIGKLLDWALGWQIDDPDRAKFIWQGYFEDFCKANAPEAASAFLLEER